MKRKPKTKIVNRLLLGSIPVLLLMFFTGMPDESMAQQVTPAVICSGGETLTASSLSLDFTIGEITTESLSTGSLLLTQGFNQGPDPNTGIEEKMINGNDLKVYPNPANDRIYLFCNDEEIHPAKIMINDLQGRRILSLDFTTNPMLIHLDQLNPGFYTVSILFDNHQIINKKIIKQ